MEIGGFSLASCGLRNISRTAYNAYSGARRCTYHNNDRLRTAISFMWGSLRLAPTNIYIYHNIIN